MKRQREEPHVLLGLSSSAGQQTNLAGARSTGVNPHAAVSNASEDSVVLDLLEGRDAEGRGLQTSRPTKRQDLTGDQVYIEPSTPSLASPQEQGTAAQQQVPSQPATDLAVTEPTAAITVVRASSLIVDGVWGSDDEEDEERPGQNAAPAQPALQLLPGTRSPPHQQQQPQAASPSSPSAARSVPLLALASRQGAWFPVQPAPNHLGVGSGSPTADHHSREQQLLSTPQRPPAASDAPAAAHLTHLRAVLGPSSDPWQQVDASAVAAALGTSPQQRQQLQQQQHGLQALLVGRRSVLTLAGFPQQQRSGAPAAGAAAGGDGPAAPNPTRWQSQRGNARQRRQRSRLEQQQQQQMQHTHNHQQQPGQARPAAAGMLAAQPALAGATAAGGVPAWRLRVPRQLLQGTHTWDVRMSQAPGAVRIRMNVRRQLPTGPAAPGEAAMPQPPPAAPQQQQQQQQRLSQNQLQRMAQQVQQAAHVTMQQQLLLRMQAQQQRMQQSHQLQQQQQRQQQLQQQVPAGAPAAGAAPRVRQPDNGAPAVAPPTCAGAAEE